MNAFAERYGPWALVTGASDGIGEAVARELAAMGLNLILCARRQRALQALATELSNTHGVACQVLALDLASAESAAMLESECASRDIGLLVAAAGFGSSGPLLKSDVNEEASMLAVNCGAVLRQCQWLIPRLTARGRGSLVLLSSLVAFQGCPGSAHYAATKAWVQGLAEGLRLELASSGINVLAIAPGPVASGFGRRANMSLERAASPKSIAASAVSALKQGASGTIRPGWLSKVLGWSLATAPRSLRVRIMGQIMEGMIMTR